MKGVYFKTGEIKEGTTDAIVRACFNVHKILGPGFPEACYEEAVCRELTEMNVPFLRQHKLIVEYKGQPLLKTFRVDIMVNDEVIVEIKSVSEILPVHEAQLLAYLKASGKKIGYLFNFNAALLKDGIRRKKLGFD